VLPADRLDEAPLEEVRPQFGQGPAAVGEANGRGRLVGEPTEARDLGLGEAGRGADAARPLQGGEAVPLEGVQVGVGGVRVYAEQAGDGPAGQAGGVEQEGLGAAALPGVEGALEEGVEPAKFVGSGRADREWAWHGWTSVRGRRYSHSHRN